MHAIDFIVSKAMKQRIADVLAGYSRRLKERGYGTTALGRAIIDLGLYPDDVRTINRTYFEIFGERPNLKAPSTFNEKIQAAKLFPRYRRHVMMTDKLAVRDFVESKIGPEILPKIYWSGTDLMDASTLELPVKFLIKANQSSGNNIVVRDSSKLDWQDAAAQARIWLKQDFGAKFAEWQYRWIPPKIFIEGFLEGPNGDAAVDYKFFCFGGRVVLIQVNMDRFTNHTMAICNRDFERLPVARHLSEYPRYEGILSPPQSLKRMIEIAETLSQGEPFVRVDLYDGEVPMFGELTLSPGAGLVKFDPADWDLKLGQMWPS